MLSNLFTYFLKTIHSSRLDINFETISANSRIIQTTCILRMRSESFITFEPTDFWIILSGKKYLLDHIMSDKKGEENEEAEKKATSSRAEPYFVSAFT